MSKIKKIKKVLKSKPTIEGAGVHLKRVFGFQQEPRLDPFLLLDDFGSDDPADYAGGFPWHPHRGIETITYVLNGEVEHGDSLGNAGVIRSGDVQWMTAGSGIIHQEMPQGDPDGRLWGFQLWANLPATHKMMAPRYRGIQRAEIPEVELENGARVRVICGQVNGVAGPVQDVVIDPEYLDIQVPAGARFTHTVPHDYTVFAYVIGGRALFEPDQEPYDYEVEGQNYFDFQRERFTGPESLVIFEPGDELVVTTEEEGVRFLLISGKPIGEPVAWYGPIVMNTQEELRTAFEEYQQGTFLKHGRQE
jgi:hypothetical protein